MPRIGDEAWEVVWADPDSVQLDDAGEVRHDMFNFVSTRFASESAAMTEARRVLLAGLDFYDCVRVRPVAFVRPGRWEPSGDAEHYSRADFQEQPAGV